MKQNDARAEDIETIEARVPALRLKHTNRPQPRSALDAKLSVQYVLARAVTDRAVTLPHFEGDAYREARVESVMQRVRPEAFDAPTEKALGDAGAAIALTLKDGRRLEGTIRRPVGHEPGVPLSPELHRSKFDACVSRRLTSDQAQRVYDSIQCFEDVADVRKFTDSISAASS